MRATGEHSLSTRLSSWFGTITLGTRLIFILCVSIFLFGFVYGFRGFLYCMQPAAVAQNYGKAYTFLLSGIFHVNALHLVFNMMSWCPMGSNFERSIGTIPFLYLMFLFDWFGSFLHFIFASILHYSHTYPYFYFSCSAGLSGVIFSLLTIECNRQEGNRSCFGFNIRSRLYPFLLLFLIQLVYGEASFLGHFSGIVVGYLYEYGLLNWLIADKLLDRIERSRVVGPLVSLNGFILRPSSFSLPVSVSIPASASATVSSWTTPSTEAFSGQGRVLGSTIQESPSAPPESPILEKH